MNKWHFCKKKMPDIGEPVEVEFRHSGLTTVAYLDVTQTVEIFVWVDEFAGTFHGTPDILRWRKWDGTR